MDIFDENEYSGTRQRFDNLPDYHLRNPLKPLNPNMLINMDLIKKDRRLTTSINMMRTVRQNIVIGDHYALWTNPEWFDLGIGHNEIGTAIGDALTRLRCDRAITHIYKITEMEKALIHFSSNAYQHLISEMSSFHTILTLLNALSSRRPVPAKYQMNFSDGMVRIMSRVRNKIIITPSLIGLILPTNEDTIKIFAGDWVRCASDVATEKFLLNLGSTIGNHINEYHYPSPDFISEIIDWGRSVLLAFGNSGYKLLKTYEALCVGYLLLSSDDDMVDKSLFWKNTVRDLIEDDSAFAPYILKFKDLLEKNIISVHWISQVYGLHRIWGHPLVDSQKGMEKVITIGRKNIVLSDRTPNMVGNHFKKMFMSSFLKRYKRYPAHTYSGCDDAFKQLLSNNDPAALDPRFGYQNELQFIDLDKNYQIPETFNLSMIVADKSVSPTKSELIKNIRTKDSVMNAELRRGVLRWLNDTAVDPREFLKQVNDGLFPDDQKIIGLTPKERELNPTPRMFALMSHMMRVYVVITESMISEHILPMFPQITMTDNLLDLNKKIYSNVSRQRKNITKSNKIGKKTVCMSLDFEKWNGHMRKQSTYLTFLQLGRLFGLPNLYNATYDIFSDSYIYLADGSYVPDVQTGKLVINEPFSFSDHQGGMEGLRQKGWTLFTIVCLDMICSRHHCTFTSMGMGDNQILMLTFYTYNVDASGKILPSGIKELKKNLKLLFKDLIEVFGELGLPLKPLETWTSESLFLYGKYPVWKGIPLTMDLKRIMRVFPFSNIDIMTVENILNTVAGSATAATQSSPCVFLSYITGLVMLSFSIRQLLRYHPLTGESLLNSLDPRVVNRKMIKPNWKLTTGSGLKISYDVTGIKLTEGDLVMLMMSVPRSLGGYVTFSLQAMAVRGFPDPLSRDLYTMHCMITSCEDTEQRGLARLFKNWSEIILMPDANYKMLMEDILSVNLLNPVTPMSKVRQSVAQFLSSPSRIRNPEFLELLKLSTDPGKDKLAQILCSGDVLHIRLLHDIYESTITGYVDSIVSKVTKTSTIQKLAVKSARRDISDEVMMTEQNYFLFFNWRSSASGVPWNNDCPTSYARYIRQVGWGKELKGITVPFPLCFLAPSECYNSQQQCDCSDGYLSIHVSDTPTKNSDWDFSIGSALPYMGSITKEKVLVQSGVKVYSSEPLIRRPLNMLRTINWFVPDGSETSKVMISCAKAVTDIQVEQFKGVTEGTSGAESHRYHDSSLSHGALSSSNYLYTTRYHMSTDSLSRYSKGGVNYDVHYQSLLCLISESLNHTIFTRMNSGIDIPRCQHWKQTCYECVKIVTEEFTDIKHLGGSAYIPYRKSNRYLYVPEARISYIWETRPFEAMVAGILSENEYNHMSGRDKNHWLIDTFSDKIISQLTYGSDEVSELNQVDLHTGEIFNRVAYLKLSPLELFTSVAAKALLVSEFQLLSGNDYILPLGRRIRKKAQSMIANTASGNLLGLGIMFSWAELRGKMPESFVYELDEDPPSLAGACEASRRILFGIVSKLKMRDVRKLSRTDYLIDEMKDNGLSYKLIANHKLHSFSSTCIYCSVALKAAPVSSFTGMICSLECKKGHIILERYSLKTKSSRVTMDRLRKDCSESALREISRKASKRVTTLKLEIPSKPIIIFDSAHIRPKYFPWHNKQLETYCAVTTDFEPESSQFCASDVIKTITKPTSSVYKYIEVLQESGLKRFGSSKILLLGDGSGGTSALLLKMYPHIEIVVSTLVDSDKIIPQTMPHLFDHESETKNLDKRTMVNKVNNILNDRWTEDWLNVMKESDVLVSDIEIMMRDRETDRLRMWEKLLSATSWKLAIIKDYIFSVHEFMERLNCVVAHTNNYRLITSCCRQRKQPECWWILQNTHQELSIQSDSGYLTGFAPEITGNIWNRYLEAMYKDHDMLGVHCRYVDKILLTPDLYMSLLNRARMYCSIPNIGGMVPMKDDFTEILGKLQSGGKPKEVALSRLDQGRRLYKSDEARLRENMLIMACSMLASINARTCFLNENKKWALRWIHRKNQTTWLPYLVKMTKNTTEIDISNDQIGVLNRHFNKLGLLYNIVKDTIRFEYNRKKVRAKHLHFPVAKNMIIRLGGLVPKNKKESLN
ncbi:TPA_asm: L [Wurfbainia alphacytorhabdovirus 1]|nr:TPA_asm: L [Wurfbainia alphacytorhabdovirus 1]